MVSKECLAFGPYPARPVIFKSSFNSTCTVCMDLIKISTSHIVVEKCALLLK